MQYQLILLYDTKHDEERSIIHMKNAEILDRNKGNIEKDEDGNWMSESLPDSEKLIQEIINQDFSGEYKTVKEY